MENNHPELHLELSKFAKSIFEGNDEYNLLKNPNEEKYFDPIPNEFYGFCIPIPDSIFAPAHILTIDIDHEDITDTMAKLELKPFDPGIGFINSERIKFEYLAD